jgi:hypothetical protein
MNNDKMSTDYQPLIIDILIYLLLEVIYFN